jgi:hypothetical protein
MFNNRPENKLQKKWREKHEKWKKLPTKERLIYPSLTIIIVCILNYYLF